MFSRKIYQRGGCVTRLFILRNKSYENIDTDRFNNKNSKHYIEYFFGRIEIQLLNNKALCQYHTTWMTKHNKDIKM